MACLACSEEAKANPQMSFQDYCQYANKKANHTEIAECRDRLGRQGVNKLDLAPAGVEHECFVGCQVESRRRIWSATEFVNEKGVGLKDVGLQVDTFLPCNEENEEQWVYAAKPHSRELVTHTLVGNKKANDMMPHHIRKGQEIDVFEFSCAESLHKADWKTTRIPT